MSLLHRRTFYAWGRGGGAAASPFTAEGDLLFSSFSGTVTTEQKELYDGLIRSLKDFNLWTDAVAIYVPQIVHDTAADALINWRTPGTNNLVLAHGAGADPTFLVEDGLTTDGSQNKVQFFNPTTIGATFAQNSNFIAMQATVPLTASGSIIAWYDGTDGFSIQPGTDSADSIVFRSNQAATTVSNTGVITKTNNFIGINRSGASATQLSLDGAAVAIATRANEASTAFNNHVLQFGSLTDSAFRAGTLHFLYASPTRTAQQVEDLFNIVDAYRTAI